MAILLLECRYITTAVEEVVESNTTDILTKCNWFWFLVSNFYQISGLPSYCLFCSHLATDRESQNIHLCVQMSSFKLLTTSEVKKHSRTGDLWLVIHDDVYDVSQFMEDHPYVRPCWWSTPLSNCQTHMSIYDELLIARYRGGADALLSQGGIDATSAFEDVGHSGDARAIMDRFRIGKAEKMVSHISLSPRCRDGSHPP